MSKMSDDLRSGALVYHKLPKPGKLEIQSTKPLGNQRDLALAYSPGVAAPCEAIAADPSLAADYTARQNLVAVISNGTAVLGLGDIGPLASKPVMEGKAVLFKKFAGIDVFDIEVAEKNVDKLVDVIAALEPTFGGINLEDIKAPECFEVEARLRERMAIPVFHDDQHGTAIIVGAAVTNALAIAGKKIADAKIVASGAGAAALACLNLLVSLGAKRVCDRAWQWTREREVRSVVLPDARALAACERFLDDHRILVEPACGASLAPVYDAAPELEGCRRLLVVVCGGVTATLAQIRAWAAR